MKFDKAAILRTLVFLALAWLFLFFRQDQIALKWWDESRTAINALEMRHHGNLLVRTFDFQPEKWETKPPLQTWLQLFFMWLFGPNELALRLPAILATLFVCFLMVRLGRQLFGSTLPGYLMAGCLLTLPFLVFGHNFRSADQDGLHAAILFALMYCLFRAIEAKKPGKWLWLSGLCVGLGILAKSIAGMMFLPGAGLYLLLAPRGRRLFKNPRLWLAGLAGLGMAALYYLLREQQQPGYLQMVLENEVVPRSTGGESKWNDLEWHGPWWYFDNMIRHHASNWFPLFLVATLAGLLHRGQVARFTGLFALTFVVFQVIIANVSQKAWYITPSMPLLAALAGMLFYLLFLQVLWPLVRKRLSRWNWHMGGALFAFCLFAMPALWSISATNGDFFKEKREHHLYGYFINHLREKRPELKEYTVAYYNYQSHFYTLLMNKEYGARLTIDTVYADFRPGQLIMKCHELQEEDAACPCPPEQEEIEALYETETVEQFRNCKLLRIIGRKTGLQD